MNEEEYTKRKELGNKTEHKGIILIVVGILLAVIASILPVLCLLGTIGIIVMIIGLVILLVGMQALWKLNEEYKLELLKRGQSKHQAPTPPQEIKKQEQDKFCPFCGKNNPVEYNFCSSCKKPLPEVKR